jgi:flagellin
MALNVISNFAANVAHRNLVASDAQLTSSLAKLSAGKRVVAAKDDAASLAIGSRLAAEVAAMKQANVNAVQASSLLQIADGALAKISDILVRMKTLAVQAGSGQLSDTERNILDTEYQQLLSEIDRIALDTEFNGTTLIAGTAVTVTAINGQTAANNFVEAADGFQSVVFDTTVTNTTDTTAVFTFSFDATSDVLTATNLETGESQGVDIGSAAIAVNATQTINFGNLGTTVTLNSAFDKTVDIAPTSATTFTSDSDGQIEVASITLGTVDAAFVTNVSDNTVSIDASGGVSTSTLTLGALTGTADLGSTGTQTVVLSDGTNDVEVTFNVTAAFTTDDDAVEISVGDLGTLVLGTNGTSNTSFSFKLGTGTTVNVDTLSITLDQVTGTSLSLNGGDVKTADNADTASDGVSAAIDTLNNSRAGIGASQNRLEFAAANLATAIENAEAARSNLLDLDIALEITVFTSKQILVQTGISMLAQANQLPQNLLRLFQ